MSDIIHGFNGGGQLVFGDIQFNRGCKLFCVTARFKHEELTAPQTQS